MHDHLPAKAYLVLCAGVLLNLVLGVLYAWSIFAAALIAQWGWSSLQATLPYALAIGLFAFGVMVAGYLQDRFGPRPVALIGGVLAGLGLLIAGFATSHNTLPVVIGFGVMGGLGIGFGYASATPPAVKWFGLARKGLVTGIVVAGFGLASIYIAPLTTVLIDRFGIASTFRILGIAFGIIATICGLFLVNPATEAQEASGGGGGDDSDNATQADDASLSSVVREAPTDARETILQATPREMLRSARFYQMWFAYACAAFAGLMIIGTMAKIAAVQIPGVALGFLLVATLAAGNAAGRLIAGMLLDRIGAVKTMLIVFVGQAVAMLVLGSVHTLPVMIALVSLIGAFYGANLSIFPALTVSNFGTRMLGANYGILFTAYGIGGVFGSLTAGKLFDLTGSYQPAFVIAAILCMIAAVLAPFAGRTRSTVSRDWNQENELSEAPGLS